MTNRSQNKFRVGDRVLIIWPHREPLGEPQSQILGKTATVAIVAQTKMVVLLEEPLSDWPSTVTVTVDFDCAELILDPKPWSSPEEAEQWLSDRDL